MATKAKGSKKSSSSTSATKVTRIKASDSAPVKTKAPATKTNTKTQKTNKPAEAEGAKRNPLRAFGGYFAGAWYELKQVHWPNRRATWNMTLALIGFTAFFVIVILLLDALFQYVFNLILG